MRWILWSVTILIIPTVVFGTTDLLIGSRTPVLSPDASAIAFSYMGDIWLVSSDGGKAHRLTVHEDYDAYPHFSPDGKWVAYTGTRTGGGDVYIMPVEGGAPTRLTVHSAWDQVIGWMPDSKEVLFLSARDTRFEVIYRVGLDGTLPRKITYDRTADASVSPDGQWLAWERGYTPWWRKHYRGYASRDIWIRAIDGGQSRKLTKHPGNDMTPMWSPDGRTIYFISERKDSTTNLWSVTIGGGEEPSRLTNFKGDWVRFPSMAANGTKIVFEREGRIWSFETVNGKTVPVDITAPSDDKWNNLRRRNMTNRATEFAFSLDEEQFAFVVRGEIYCAPVDDGELEEAIRLTETSAREKDLCWSKDGKTLFFVSDRNGNDDIFSMTSTDIDEEKLCKSRKREVTQLTDDYETENHIRLSPDSKKIMYDHGSRILYTMDVDGGNQEAVMGTPQILHADWSPDGKWIAFSRTTHGHREDIYIVPSEEETSST